MLSLVRTVLASGVPINQRDAATKEDIKKIESIQKDAASALKLLSPLVHHHPSLSHVYLSAHHILSGGQEHTEITQCDPGEWLLDMLIHQLLQPLGLCILV